MRGLPAKQIFASSKFDALIGELSDPKRQVNLNIACKNEYVSTVEIEIKTVKEQCRACCAYLKFDRFPRRLTKEIVSATVSWLNCVPRSDKVSDKLSPQTIFTRKHINVKHKFRDFVQCAVNKDPTNTMDKHTFHTIFLQASN